MKTDMSTYRLGCRGMLPDVSENILPENTRFEVYKKIAANFSTKCCNLKFSVLENVHLPKQFPPTTVSRNELIFLKFNIE